MRNGMKIESSSPVDILSLEDMKISDEARKYWAFQKPTRVRVPAGAESADVTLHVGLGTFRDRCWERAENRGRAARGCPRDGQRARA